MATTKVVIECKDRVEQVKSISFYRESQFFLFIISLFSSLNGLCSGIDFRHKFIVNSVKHMHINIALTLQALVAWMRWCTWIIEITRHKAKLISAHLKPHKNTSIYYRINANAISCEMIWFISKEESWTKWTNFALRNSGEPLSFQSDKEELIHQHKSYHVYRNVAHIK